MKVTGSNMYNFFSIGKDKYGVESFTKGSNGKFVTLEEALTNTSVPLCWAGSHKNTLLNHCKKHNIKYYNLDSGYFGNTKAKIYKRVSTNSFYDCGPIISRPSDRLNKLSLEIKNFRRGSQIVVIPPDYKKADTAQIDQDEWLQSVVCEIRKYCDRPIIKRHRPVGRDERLTSNKLEDLLANDVYCVIGYPSNALVESVLCGIPVISLGVSAVTSLSVNTIENIEYISDIDNDTRYSWLCHLSYRQFTDQEMLSGLAWDYISR